MNSKSITLILTLLFCLSGSVLAEDKKESINEYKSYKEFESLRIKYSKSYNEIIELSELIAKKEGKAPNGDANTLISISRIVHSLSKEMWSLRIILTYEDLILNQSIKNDHLKNHHNTLRRLQMLSFNSMLGNTAAFTKTFQIYLKNTTAVIAVNDCLKILNNMEVWYNKNKDFKIK
jgi:hypothetical protein